MRFSLALTCPLLFTCLAYGQIEIFPPAGPIPVYPSGDPAGVACLANQLTQYQGIIYTCPPGTLIWTQSPGGSTTLLGGAVSGTGGANTINGAAAGFVVAGSGGTTTAPASVAAVAHNWIDSFVAGVAHTSQPNYTDLAGVLPSPSASTLGGIESITSLSHNWVAYIDTSGVPHQSQPVCADLGDAAASCSTNTTNAANITTGTLPNARIVALPNANLANSAVTINSTSVSLGGSITVTANPPAQANTTVLSNISGASAQPSANTIVSLTPALGTCVTATNYGNGTTNSIASAITALTGSANCIQVPWFYPTTEAIPGLSTANATVGTGGLNTNIVPSGSTTANNLLVREGRYGSFYEANPPNCLGLPPTLGGYNVCSLESYSRYLPNITSGVAFGLTNQVLVDNIVSGGFNYNNGSTNLITPFGAAAFRQNKWTPGISSVLGVQGNCFTIGDCLGLQIAMVGLGGTNAANDERLKAYDIEVSQATGQLSAQVSGSLPTGATIIPYASATNNGYAGEQLFFIDKNASGTVGLNVTAITNNTSGPTAFTYTATSGSVTATPAYGFTATAVLAASLNTPVTISYGSFTVGSSANITASTMLCVVDNSDFEQVVVASSNGSGFTTTFTKPKASGAYFAVSSTGGCGFSLDIAADDQNAASMTGLGTGTYVSGITATGATGTYCTLSSFNNGNVRGSAQLILSGTNTPSTNANAISFTQPGVNSTAAATSATASNGSGAFGTAATCSGTATITTTMTSPGINGSIQGTLNYAIPILFADAAKVYGWTEGAGQWITFLGVGGQTQWTVSNEAATLYPSAQIYSVEKNASGQHTGTTGNNNSVLTLGPNNITTAASDAFAVPQYHVQGNYIGYNIAQQFRPLAFGTAGLSYDFYGVPNGQLNLLALTNHGLASFCVPGGGVFNCPGGISMSGEVYRGIGFQQAPDEYWMRSLFCPANNCNTTQTIIGAPNYLAGGDNISYFGGLGNLYFAISQGNSGSSYTFKQNLGLTGGITRVVSAASGATPNFNLGTGDLYTLTLTQAASPTLNGLAAGRLMAFKITEAASGNYGVTFPSNMKGFGAINTANSAITVGECRTWDGTNCYAVGPLMDSTGNAYFAGTVSAAAFNSATNCANGASPAVCAAAPSGAVAIPTGVSPTLTVNTSAVTANSRILLTVDDSVTIGGTTCNSTLATLVGGIAITARMAATSFTISYNGTIATNPVCVSYSIVN